MIRLCWWLVDMVSQGLEPDERDDVRGDLAECGETAGQVLCQVLGLVVRRQAAFVDQLAALGGPSVSCGTARNRLLRRF